jgi:hypothetical protein
LALKTVKKVDPKIAELQKKLNLDAVLNAPAPTKKRAQTVKPVDPKIAAL